MATVEESDSVLDGYWTDTRVHDCCLGDGHINPDLVNVLLITSVSLAYRSTYSVIVYNETTWVHNYASHSLNRDHVQMSCVSRTQRKKNELRKKTTKTVNTKGRVENKYITEKNKKKKEDKSPSRP